MIYFLQDPKESDAMSIEIEELRYELDKSFEHSYIVARSNFFNKMHRELGLTNAIPVGTIEFIQSYLSSIHGIGHMNPIEVPKELRLDKFLLRDYKIVKSADVPKGVSKFVKDVSVLKQPTFVGNTNNIPEDFFKPEIRCKFPGDVTLYEPGHLYQVSDIIDILAEYRVIVMDNKIMGIQFYDGDLTIMPSPKEIDKIKEMVIRYSVSKTCPRAYAMDVAVVSANNEDRRDLALIEIQPTVAIGTYGCRGPFLPHMYKLGLDWYIQHNIPIEETN